ncbi:MAG: hypothetical protein Q3976_08795 [Corynebacterium sp.]|nr:hypothetical protein [Corynebacterium sp.]
MYQYLWNKLPGNWQVKLAITVVAAIIIFFLLMEVIFPWVSSLMPYNDVAV